MAKILLVDDDASIRVTLKGILGKAGHKISEVDDGSKVERAMAGEAPDLIITDIIMPNQEGLETIMKLKCSHPKLPIIGISSDSSYLDLAYDLGADAIVAKPIHGKQLIGTVDNLLGVYGK
jgi:DNA-binding response OmpR family regulator